MTNPSDPWQHKPGEQPQQQRYPGGAMPPLSEPSTPMERPNSVELSFKLWLVYLALGLIGAVLTFAVLDELIAASADEAGVSGEDVADAGRGVMIFAVVIGLVILGLVVALVFQMRKGKNWARITLTVLGALGVLSSVRGIGDAFSAEGIGPVIGIVSLLQVLLVIGAIVLMYMKDANPYFQQPR
jgi:cytochrome c biogenesis protein ResB